MALAIHTSDCVVLRTRRKNYLTTPGGVGPQVVVTPNLAPDPSNSDEIWWIEPVNKTGPIESGDMVFLRSRVGKYLNTPSGAGPQVVMSPNHSPNPNGSDEIWWVEKVAGSGPVSSGDPIFLRSRGKKYLNTPGGGGPAVVMSPNNSNALNSSDEIWWIDQIYSFVNSGGVNPLWSGASAHGQGPLYMRHRSERMELDIKVSRTGIVEARRKATIKKQSGTWRHIFYFTILDANGNTLWFSPVETLTFGAKVNALNQPQDYDKEDKSVYSSITLPQGRTIEEAWSIEAISRQESTGSGTLLQQIEDAADQVKRLNKAYEDIKGTTILKDAEKAYLAAS